jgi:DNA-binding IclR family transcriptional regulator
MRRPDNAAEITTNSVQSVEVGARALQALAASGPAASLSTLALAAGMPAAKLHRYLQALIATGFATQDQAGGRYSLGPAAVQLGLAALGRMDPAATVAAHLPGLRDATGHSCFFAVWGNHGPTVVQVLQATGTVTVVTRVGSVLPVYGSATGLAFVAHLPVPALAALGLAPPAGPLEKRLAGIRASGLSLVHGLMLAGIDAAAAPVFGMNGIEGVLTVLGPAGAIDLSDASPILRKLTQTAATCGLALGDPPQRRRTP